MSSEAEISEIEQSHMPDMREVVGRAGTPGQGPYVHITLAITGDTIAKATFVTYGCPYSILCANWLTGWLHGKTAEKALVVEPGDIAVMVGGLPLGKEHVAQLAVTALRDAIAQWSEVAT